MLCQLSTNLEEAKRITANINTINELTSLEFMIYLSCSIGNGK